MPTKMTVVTAPDIECDGCANSIRRALARVPGVESVDVNVETKTVQVTHDGEQTTPDQIAAALDDAGFPIAEGQPA
jgi:copper chaperone CopZ